jgi:hypothetical protein
MKHFNDNISKFRTGARGKRSYHRRTRVEKVSKGKNPWISCNPKITRARQHSRLTWMRKGDTNTRFFHLHANCRKKKTFIATLKGESGQVVAQGNKLTMAFNHFAKVLGTSSVRTKAIDWGELGYQRHDLQDLDAPFTAQEVETVVKNMPSDKSARSRWIHRRFLQEVLEYNQRGLGSGHDVFLQQPDISDPSDYGQHNTSTEESRARNTRGL